MIRIDSPLLYHEFIRSRRSVRQFRVDPVPSEILERILETATRAPSAHNRQPWRFVVVTSPEGKEGLAAGMGAKFRQDLAADGLPEPEIRSVITRSYDRITNAPVVIALCFDGSLGDQYPDPVREMAEQIMGVQSVALAGGTLMLAAHAEGLGSVWMCAPLFAPDSVRFSLGLPEIWNPQALILLGYPLTIPKPRPRQLLAEIVRYV
jgi:F420 biosynthesis protein FbiB-like protein